jgi:hypothetical protein
LRHKFLMAELAKASRTQVSWFGKSLRFVSAFMF